MAAAVWSVDNGVITDSNRDRDDDGRANDILFPRGWYWSVLGIWRRGSLECVWVAAFALVFGPSRLIRKIIGNSSPFYQ